MAPSCTQAVVSSTTITSRLSNCPACTSTPNCFSFRWGSRNRKFGGTAKALTIHTSLPNCSNMPASANSLPTASQSGRTCETNKNR